jgi:hypothetical protein
MILTPHYVLVASGRGTFTARCFLHAMPAAPLDAHPGQQAQRQQQLDKAKTRAAKRQQRLARSGNVVQDEAQAAQRVPQTSQDRGSASE